MTPTEILEALRKLTATERLTVPEAVVQQIRRDLRQMEQPPAQLKKKCRYQRYLHWLRPRCPSRGGVGLS